MTKYRVFAKNEEGELCKLPEPDHDSKTAAGLWAEVLKIYYPGIEFEVKAVLESEEK